MSWWTDAKTWAIKQFTPPEKNDSFEIPGDEDGPDPEELTVKHAYQTRWVWYHTILCILLLMVNMNLLILIAILAIKL